MGNLNFTQRHHQERRFRQLNNSIRGRLNQYIRAVGDAVETDFSKRNINVNPLVPASIGDLLSECFEFSVQCKPTASFFLLSLKLLFVSITVLPSAISSFIKLHFRSFPIELDVLGLPFTDHDRSFQVDMDDNNHFVCTGLEKQVLNVAEKNINMLATQWRLISETVLVNFDFAWYSFAIQRWSKIHIGKFRRPTI